MDNYSVLMSVYCKAKPEHLVEAVESMLRQTVVTNDFVIVCDGPLTEELDQVLDRFDQANPGVFQLVRLPENVGIGAAANIGLQYCKNELIAKMDADDIAVPDRCEKQLKLFAQDPALTVSGGFIEEFSEDADKPFAIRGVPLTNDEIRRFARRRQPFNNMTVMYRRSAVQAVGGYRDLRRSEDYDLYLRLLHNGYVGSNLSDILVKARVNSGSLGRRGSLDTLRGCARSRGYAVKIGFSSVWDYLVCVNGELLIMICPGFIRRFLYSTFLRQRC